MTREGKYAVIKIKQSVEEIKLMGKAKSGCTFVGRLEPIENIMGFSHPFIPSYDPGPRGSSFLFSLWQRLFHMYTLDRTPDS